MTKQQGGIFLISLDFELFWGVQHSKSIESYKENLLGVRSAVPALLRLFDDYQIHATWATVGFLFFETREELIGGLPASKPNYVNTKLSSYTHISSIDTDETKAPFCFAPSLIKMIASYPYQEIGTHTMSHYFCLEQGQNLNTFRDDLAAAVKVAKRYNLSLESLVFPRNQVNSKHLPSCVEMGIKAYRGPESFWIYAARNQENESLLIKGLRLVDSYLNISGCNAYSLDEINHDLPFNIPGSRFLRPYSKRLKVLEPLRLQRIRSDLTTAAKRGLVYHLWWHPHNFGINLPQNLLFLQSIFDHYSSLRDTYGMQSLNMKEVAHLVSNKGAQPCISTPVV